MAGAESDESGGTEVAATKSPVPWTPGYFANQNRTRL